MVAVIEWPADLLRLTTADLFLVHADRSAGRSLVGVEQTVSPGYAVWSVRFVVGLEWQPARIKQFEALVAQMQGRRNIGAWPIFDAYAYDADRAPLQQAWSDGTFFTDGTGLTDEVAVQPMVTTAAAAAGAVSITVGLTTPVRPRFEVGDMFSIDGFLHRVTSATAGGAVGFLPALRRAVPSGTVLQTAPAIFYGRFETVHEGRRPRDLLSHGTEIAIALVEAFDS